MLPESDGNDIYKDSDDYLEWVRNDLRQFVEQRYPHFRINTSRYLLAAESAGAHIGVRWLLKHRTMFAGAYLRSPLVDDYRRSPGLYMHREVGLEEAATIFCDLLGARAKLRGGLPPAKSRRTPEGQFVAYSSSVLHAWALLWNSVTARELLRDAPKQQHDCPILIVHGILDEKVPLSSAETLADELRTTHSTSVTLQELRGAGHCSDYDLSYDSEELVCVRKWIGEVLEATIAK